MPPSPWSQPECEFCLTREPPPPCDTTCPAHEIETAYELGWSRLSNGERLNRAEAHGFQAFITTDRNLWYQQPPPPAAGSTTDRIAPRGDSLADDRMAKIADKALALTRQGARITVQEIRPA